jgi:hypothetical protein
MPTFTRVEFSTGPSLRSPRVVFLIEFPDESLERIKKEKASLEVEAHHVALHTIGALKLGMRGDMNLVSSTLSKMKKPIELGEASYVTEGGCRVWVIKGYEQMSPRF